MAPKDLHLKCTSSLYKTSSFQLCYDRIRSNLLSRYAIKTVDFGKNPKWQFMRQKHHNYDNCQDITNSHDAVTLTYQ